MITWKNTDSIIFDLSSVLYTDQTNSSHKLLTDCEKLFFRILDDETVGSNLFLVSDYSNKELTKIVKILGLDFYFPYITSSESVGYKVNNIKFWQKYSAKLGIDLGNAILISNDYCAVDCVLQYGFKQAILLRNNKFSDKIEKKNLTCINQMSDLIHNKQLELESLE